MKIFKIVADGEFEAENIDDAFRRLSKHFRDLERGEGDMLLIGGHMTVQAVRDTQ